MPANATRAQKESKRNRFGHSSSDMKLEGEALQHHIGRRSDTFAHRNSKRMKTRAAKKARAISDF